MADLGSIPALKAAIAAIIFPNTTFEVSATDIDNSFIDTIDTLVGQLGISNTTYNDLKNDLDNSLLTPGSYYKFDYSPLYIVPGITALNTTIGTPSVETFVVQALSENKLDSKVMSLQYPLDDIYYDIEPAPLQVGTFNNGTVYRRVDTTKNIDVPFDLRNCLVGRLGIDFVGVPNVSAQTTGGLCKSESDPSNIGYFFQVEDNLDVFDDQDAYSGILDTNTSFDSSIPTSFPGWAYGGGGISFVPLVDVSNCSSIYIGSTYDKDNPASEISQIATVPDIMIKNSSDISVDGFNSGITVSGSRNVKIGDSNTNVLVYNSNDLSVGSFNGDLFVSSVSGTSVGSSNSTCTVCSLNGGGIGNSNSNCYLTGGLSAGENRIGNYNTSIGITGQNNFFGNSNSDLYFTGCLDNTLENNCSLITTRFSLRNKFESNVSNILLGDNIVNSSGVLTGPLFQCEFKHSVNNISTSDVSYKIFDSIFEPFVSNIILNGSASSLHLSPRNNNLDIFGESGAGSQIKGKILNNTTSSGVVTIPASESDSFYFTSGTLELIPVDSLLNKETDLTGGINEGDILKYSGGKFIPTKSYSYFPIWAEENAGLSNNNLQWAFGNGSVGDIGITLPFDCELVSMTIDAETFGTSLSVDALNDTTVVGTSSFTAGTSVYELPIPVLFTNGDILKFRTNTVVGSFVDARVCAWFRVEN